MFRESVRSTGLPGVAVPVRADLPFRERPVVLIAAVTAAIVPKTTRVMILTTRLR
jgi:hypothetical protein